MNRTTTWTYDEHGRRKTRTLPMGQMEEMLYNKAGNLVTHKKFDGSEIHYEYDELNRQVARNYPSGTADESATFDLAGQRLSTDDAYGQRSFEYDLRGRLTKVNHPTAEAISYRYDDMGNRVAVFTLDTGTTLTAQSMTYDELNRLKTVTVAGQGTWTYEYDAVGVREALHAPNGTRTDYHYDDQYRLKRLHTYKIGPTPVDLLDLHYTVDAVGNRTLITEKIAGVAIAETAYEYDDLYRLTKETRTVSLPYSREYVYDEVGNRQSQTTITGAVTEIKAYQYNNNDQLTTETIGSQIIAYDYDANGSMIEKDDSVEGVTTYTWDARDKLVATQAPAEPLVEMTYDSDGNRVSKTLTSGGATTTTLFLVDVNNGTGYSQVFRETDGSGVEQVHYLYGDDLLVQFRGSQLHHYHYDALGSTRALSDATGAATDAYVYYGFGELLLQTGTTRNEHLFTGERFDPNLRYYILRARYHNPSIGRFVSFDPFSGIQTSVVSLHKYLYAHANPALNLDPSGMITLTELGSVGGQISNLVRIGMQALKTIDRFMRILDLIRTITQMYGIITGPGVVTSVTGILQQFKNSFSGYGGQFLSPADFAKDFFKRAAQSLADNLLEITTNVVKYKASEPKHVKLLNNYFNNPSLHLIIIMPTPPIPLPTPPFMIPTGLTFKLGKKHLPVVLYVPNGLKAGGLFGVGLLRRNVAQDMNNPYQFFRLDYHSLTGHNLQQQKLFHAWQDQGNSIPSIIDFHYATPKIGGEN